MKDIATRERSLHGGHVWVVRHAVLDQIGADKEDVPLKPSAAEVAAAATAHAAGQIASELGDKKARMQRCLRLPIPGLKAPGQGYFCLQEAILLHSIKMRISCS